MSTGFPCAPATVDLEAEVSSSASTSSTSTVSTSSKAQTSTVSPPIPRVPLPQPIIRPSGDPNSCSDFTERRSRNCLRVATQREIRKNNSPRRLQRLKYCKFCKISVTARQLPSHEGGRAYRNAVLRTNNKFRCEDCERDFVSSVDLQTHLHSNSHHTVLRHRREPL